MADIDVGQISEALNNKVDLNQLNTNTQGLAYGSGWNMPSSNYVDLTLEASGTTYTAPANGWYYYCGLTTSTSQYILMAVNSTDLSSDATIRQTAEYCATDLYSPGGSGATIAEFLPVKKGDKMTIIGNVSSNDRRFRFIYAEGSQPS